MFKLAMQTSGLSEIVGLDEAYRLIKEAGFDAVDANSGTLLSEKQTRIYAKNEVFKPGKSDLETLEAFKPWRDAALKYGIENYQCHAPFPTYGQAPGHEEYDEYMMDALRKCILGADYINCRNIVIHPFYRRYEYQLDPEETWELNVEQYGRLAKTALENGVVICIENMNLHTDTMNYGFLTNQPKELARLIDTLNERAGGRAFAACLDVGHAILASQDPKNFMTTLGDRLQVFHVHDNDGVHDQHVMPFTGNLDWDRFVEGLKAIHFNKTLSFETFRTILRIKDPALFPYVLKFIERTGRRFSERAEG